MDDKIEACLNELRTIQDDLNKLGVHDIYSNSKIYEIMIANELKHTPIAGHSGTRNGKTKDGEFEYKHYKRNSSNHSWTFNDYSDNVIEKLKGAKSVIFAHIDDTNRLRPVFDWYIEVSGIECSKYLKQRTTELLKRQPKGRPNARRMINFSPNQLMNDLKLEKTTVTHIGTEGRFTKFISRINDCTDKLEGITGISEVLTSNKLWELITSIPLGHQVLSEQSGHDAKDPDGNYYEYKVAKNHSWNFQDISDNVLRKYKKDKDIILAVVDKENLRLVKLYVAESKKVVSRLREKLDEKKEKYRQKNKELRRLTVSLTKGDLKKIDAIDYLESMGVKKFT